MKKIYVRVGSYCSLFLLLFFSNAFAYDYSVMAFGDSITKGRDGYTPYTTNLQNSFGTCAYVKNEGVLGEQTSEGVDRINSELTQNNPDYVLLMEGANDAIWSVSPSTVKYNLGKMIDKISATGAETILSNITPNTRTSGATSTIPNSYNPRIKTLATEKGVTFVNSYAAVATDWDSLNYDGLHLNEAGSIIVANVFYEALPVCKSTDNGGGGDCFIATAAFGSSLDNHVAILRKLRDQLLMKSFLGRKFVCLYYRYSPPVAHFISKHHFLRLMVRVSLYPAVAVSYCLLLPGGLWIISFSVILIIIGSIILVQRKEKPYSLR